jgi:hypothetical protein
MVSIFVHKERGVKLGRNKANGADVVGEVLVSSSGCLLEFIQVSS